MARLFVVWVWSATRGYALLFFAYKAVSTP